MQPQIISVNQLRQNFPYIQSQLQEGVSFALIHRSKLIANLTPTKKKKKRQSLKHKLTYIDQISGSLNYPKLTIKLINQIINNRYDQWTQQSLS